MLAAARSVLWITEQPRNSLMPLCPYFRFAALALEPGFWGDVALPGTQLSWPSQWGVIKLLAKSISVKVFENQCIIMQLSWRIQLENHLLCAFMRTCTNLAFLECCTRKYCKLQPYIDWYIACACPSHPVDRGCLAWWVPTTIEAASQLFCLGQRGGPSYEMNESVWRCVLITLSRFLSEKTMLMH